MNKSVLVTGVPGSGKTAICEELKKMGHKAYNIEEMSGFFKMVNKKTRKSAKDYNNYNLESVKQHDWICNKKKLQQLIKKNSQGIVFYCGTASNIDDLLPLFDKAFLLKVNEKTLRKRLSTRTSNSFGRTSEVQKWVFGWKKWWEGHIQEKGAIVINANINLNKAAKEVVKNSF